jgi:hypothetical protein
MTPRMGGRIADNNIDGASYVRVALVQVVSSGPKISSGGLPRRIRGHRAALAHRRENLG